MVARFLILFEPLDSVMPEGPLYFSLRSLWAGLQPAKDPCQSFPDGSVGKESFCNAGDLGSIPETGRSPGEGNGNLLQYFCLGNPMDRRAWWATVHGVSTVKHDLAIEPPPP